MIIENEEMYYCRVLGHGVVADLTEYERFWLVDVKAEYRDCKAKYMVIYKSPSKIATLRKILGALDNLHSNYW